MNWNAVTITSLLCRGITLIITMLNRRLSYLTLFLFVDFANQWLAQCLSCLLDNVFDISYIMILCGVNTVSCIYTMVIICSKLSGDWHMLFVLYSALSYNSYYACCGNEDPLKYETWIANDTMILIVQWEGPPSIAVSLRKWYFAPLFSNPVTIT